MSDYATTNYPVHLTYDFACSVCANTAKQEQICAAGDGLPNPSPPAGWRQVEGQLVCSSHRVQADLTLLDDMPGSGRTMWRTGVEL